MEEHDLIAPIWGLGSDRIRIPADGTLYSCLWDRPTCTFQPTLDSPVTVDDLPWRGVAAKVAERLATGAGVMTTIGA
jgi:hypothetical protein